MKNALILAAGRGSRLKGFTADKPKCLNIASGKPLLEWQIQSLKQAGIQEIRVVTGYKHELIDKYALKSFLNSKWSETNMVYSLYCALSALEAGTVISYSDILYGPSAIRRLLEATSPGMQVLFDRQWRALWESRSADPLSDTENFQMAANGRITKIGGKASSLDEPAGQYMGLIRLSRPFVEWLENLGKKEPAFVEKTDMTSLLQRFIHEGGEVYGVPTDGNWMEVDTEADLVLAEKMMASGQLNLSL